MSSRSRTTYRRRRRTTRADDRYEPSYLGGSREEKKKRGFSGCLAVIVALAVVVGGAYFAGTKGFHYLKDHLSHAADYSGPGHGKVLFEVKQGDSTTADRPQPQERPGVVASVDAFLSAAHGSKGIQVGFYQLKKKMAADDAFKILNDPKNIIKDTVTIPEGLRVGRHRGDPGRPTRSTRRADFDAALKDTAALGLPSYANGNPEGYLFPSTYAFGPKEKPIDMLKDMVDRWQQAAGRRPTWSPGPRALGKTPAEVMTIASLIQAEGRGSDMPKIARVIYNRLDGPGARRARTGCSRSTPRSTTR